MNMKQFCITAIALFLIVIDIHAQTDPIRDALYHNNFKAVIIMMDEEDEPLVIDALATSEKFQQLSYEEILMLQSLPSVTKNIISLLVDLTKEREMDIYRTLEASSIEDIVKYVQRYPQREKIVWDYIRAVLLPNLGGLSCQDLLYLQSTLPKTELSQVDKELKNRGEEKHQLLAKNVSKFLANEKSQCKQLKYMLEMIAWSFFVEGHNQSTLAYSQIPMAPDNASSAAYQYQNIINVCLSPNQLRSMLQAQVNKYCEQINKARKDYALIAGKKEYIKFSYKVPLLKINSKVDYSCLYEISNSRQAYINARENISQGSSVLGFLVGGLWGLGMQALGEWMNISSLVDSEYKARLNYVKDVHDSIEKIFYNNIRYTLNDFDSYVSENQKEYENSIKK